MTERNPKQRNGTRLLGSNTSKAESRPDIFLQHPGKEERKDIKICTKESHVHGKRLAIGDSGSFKG
jgi:hypothetical protein